MTIQSWFMYITLVLIATSTPGPAVLFIMTNATLHGHRKAIFAALGNISGLFCLGIIAVTGLGTILSTSVLLFDIIKYLGAVYLVYLGIMLIRNKNGNRNTLKNRLVVSQISSRKLYLQAFGVALSNPKAIVFLTALFPQFISIKQTLIPQFTMLIGILMIFSFSFLMFYALLAHKIKIWVNQPHRLNVFNWTSGAIFICFGILLATSSHK